MQTDGRWRDAQCVEREFWSGLAGAGEAEIQRVLDANRECAARLRSWLPVPPRSCLEVGAGPLGIGMIGFLSEIESRVAIDPLFPVEVRCAEPLRGHIDSLRRGISFLVASGERIPLTDESVELVVCCNVLDHVRDAGSVLEEMRRVIRPTGSLFLEVDTFSIAGLLKWHTLTKHLHAREILVRAHPYRFLERHVSALLNKHGFTVKLREGHHGLSGLIGASRVSSFLAIRQ